MGPVASVFEAAGVPCSVSGGHLVARHTNARTPAPKPTSLNVTVAVCFIGMLFLINSFRE